MNSAHTSAAVEKHVTPNVTQAAQQAPAAPAQAAALEVKSPEIQAAVALATATHANATPAAKQNAAPAVNLKQKMLAL